MAPSHLQRLVAELPSAGSYSLWFGPVGADAWFAHRPDAPHYAASTMKLALVMAAYEQDTAGTITLDSTALVHNDFRSAHDGSPYSLDQAEDSDAEPWKRLHTEVSLRWLAYRAIVRSSNLATNLLLDAVGTDAVAKLLLGLGCDVSKIERGIEDGTAREAGRQNLVTAGDLARQLQEVARPALLAPAAADEVVSILLAQQINSAIPTGLPADAKVAHKSGWVDGTCHDASIVYGAGQAPFILVVCSTSALSTPDAEAVIARAAASAWHDLEDSA